MRIGVTFAVISLLLVATPALAATAGQTYQYNGNTYYVVDGKNQNMNSGDRVCASVGLKCAGYTADTLAICTYFHPDASKSPSSVNGTKSGFYCSDGSQGDLACSGKKNNCQMCPQCGETSCSDQIGDQFGEMYVQCTGTSTPQDMGKTPVSTSSPAPGGGWLQNFLNWLHGLWLGLGWITPSGAPTGANHPAGTGGTGATVLTSPMVGHTGTKLPAAQCANGGECKSGNCVRDDQGVYRCSCSPLGSDYSSCH